MHWCGASELGCGALRDAGVALRGAPVRALTVAVMGP